MAGRLGKAVVVAVPIACYLGVAVYQIALPGLEYDEVFFGPATLGRTTDFSSPSSLDSRSHFSPLDFSTFSLTLGSYSLPVMLMPYWGALKVYLLAPVFSLWGVSPQTIRFPTIALGALTLLFFYLVFARLFSSRVALVALAFLASDPSYIFYTRHDFGSATLTLLVALLPLWCLGRWLETSRAGLWALAFFFFGLGLYNRLDYLGFLAALGAAALVCFRKPLLSRVGRREIVLAWFFFVLGCSPFLIFMWNRPSIAASSLFLAAPAQDFSSIARLKGYVLWTVLNGTSLYDFFSGRSGVDVGRVVAEDGEVRVGSFAAERQVLLVSSLFTGTLTPYLLLFFAFVLWFFHPPPALRMLGIFLASLLLCLLAVKGALRGHHFVILLPFVQAFLAASLLLVWEKVRKRRARVALVILGVAFMGTNLGMDLRYHRFLSATGGRGIWSEAIYDLSHYLQERCLERRCLIGDWGMGTQVVSLTGGGVPVEEFFWRYIEGGGMRGRSTRLSAPRKHFSSFMLTRMLIFPGPSASFTQQRRGLTWRWWSIVFLLSGMGHRSLRFSSWQFCQI